LIEPGIKFENPNEPALTIAGLVFFWKFLLDRAGHGRRNWEVNREAARKLAKRKNRKGY
jgi:hypothetical protein